MWGKLISAKEASSGIDTNGILSKNPIRYRGYYYDNETGFYYLQSRYYDPSVRRFISADRYISTGQGLAGHNMFAYCGNNPIARKDSTGEAWLPAIVGVVALVGTLFLAGCSGRTESGARSELANAPDLDISTAEAASYNCYGNALNKQILANPLGYEAGLSTEETFQLVINDLGSNNIRKLESIDDPIGDDEYKVAMKCGWDDYHFIRLDGKGWYNKSGRTPGLYVEQNIVEAKDWYSMWPDDKGKPAYGEMIYNRDTIYFAVKKEWDK